MRTGISDAVTMIDPGMGRVSRNANCAPHGYAGSRGPMGRAEGLAALLACGEERSPTMQAFSGIEGVVFLTSDEALAVAARDPVAAPASHVSEFPVSKPSGPSSVPVRMDRILGCCESPVRDAEGTDGCGKAGAVVHDPWSAWAWPSRSGC